MDPYHIPRIQVVSNCFQRSCSRTTAVCHEPWRPRRSRSSVPWLVKKRPQPCPQVTRTSPYKYHRWYPEFWLETTRSRSHEAPGNFSGFPNAALFLFTTGVETSHFQHAPHPTPSQLLLRDDHILSSMALRHVETSYHHFQHAPHPTPPQLLLRDDHILSSMALRHVETSYHHFQHAPHPTPPQLLLRDDHILSSMALTHAKTPGARWDRKQPPSKKKLFRSTVEIFRALLLPSLIFVQNLPRTTLKNCFQVRVLGPEGIECQAGGLTGHPVRLGSKTDWASQTKHLISCWMLESSLAGKTG